jgi:hypothetical protein
MDMVHSYGLTIQFETTETVLTNNEYIISARAE